MGKLRACAETNLRDVAANVGVCEGKISEGRFFRSSQFYSKSLQSSQHEAVSAVLDLRRECAPCKSKSIALQFLSRWRRGATDDSGNPTITSCKKCEAKLNAQSCKVAATKVFHVDLVTPGFKLQVFGAVPLVFKLQAISRLVTFRSPAHVFAEKCADADVLGYEKLYVLFLEHSKRKIATVFWLLAQEENYPVLVHCIHGKDRTGMIVMLLLLLCGVEKHQIVAEYMISSRCMLAWQKKGNDALEAHLQTAKVLSVEKEYICAALDHIQSIGGVNKYLISCGVDTATQEAVKSLLRWVQ